MLSHFKIQTALCFNESVSSSTSSEYGSYARKNFMGEQLEQPPRFLPTGALLLGALDVLLTLTDRLEGKKKTNNQKTPKHANPKSIHFQCTSLGNQVALLLHYFTNKRILQKRFGFIVPYQNQTASVKNWWVYTMQTFNKSAWCKSWQQQKQCGEWETKSLLSLILKRKSEQ